MDVSERQLRAFLAICDEGSVTRASTRLFLSQPTLSRQLSALEETLGIALIERLPRSARPTRAGRSLIDSARAVVAAHDDLRRAVRDVASGTIGDLRVGTLYSLSVGVLPALFAEWRAGFPQVRIDLHEFRHQEDLVTALLAGTVDAAVGPIPDEWKGSSTTLLTEEFVVVLAGGESRGGGEAIDMAALRDDTWVHFAPDNGLGLLLDAACAHAGFTPKTVLRTEQARAAVEYALHGLGHTLVPSNVVPAGVAMHALAEPLHREIRIAWRGSGDPLIRSLAAHGGARAATATVR